VNPPAEALCAEALRVEALCAEALRAEALRAEALCAEALRAEALRVDRGGRSIVHDLHLDVVPGELVVVCGGNGAGKSTLLRALAGELRPSGGRVTLGGRDLASWSPGELARVRAVLRQSTDVAFPMTCLEVVLLGRLPHNGGVETPGDHAIAMATLRSNGASHLAERYYASLSGGEKQRVQIARTLAQIFAADSDGSRYLLLDEPTAGLDLAHQHACLKLARRAAARGVGVVAVLHDLALAARYADRVVVLERGRMMASGTAEAVLTPELVGDVFGVASRMVGKRRSAIPRLLLGGPLRKRRSRNEASFGKEA